MTNPRALQLFKEANDLWFLQGFTNQAFKAYQAVVSEDPTDPVALYQLARALWAFSRLDEARERLIDAQRYTNRLSPLGIKLLTKEVHKLSSQPSFRFQLPVALSELDVERLEVKALSSSQWLDVAFGAGERGMFRVAAYAFSRISRPFQVLELDEDEREMELEAQNALTMLYAMRPEAEREEKHPFEATSPGSEVIRPPDPSLLTQKPRSSTSLPTKSSASPPTVTGQHPLALEISITPQKSGAKEGLSLRVVLTNHSDRDMAVNKRLLLNHPNSPPGYGEIFLYVEGPPGYQNMVRYHIRVGLPRSDQFVLLPPKHSIEKTYELLNYESFHLPGIYRVWVTYRNTIKDTVKGVPLFVGELASRALSIERV